MMPHILRSGLLPLLTLAGLLPAQSPTFTIESRPEPERPYRLFVGIDVKVLHEGHFSTVTDFGNNRALLATGTPTEVPVERIGALRFDHATKLSGIHAAIDNITSQPTYSQGNPRWEWMMAQSAVQGQVQDQLSVMEREISRSSSLPQTEALTTPDGNTVSASNPLATAINNYTNFASQNAKLTDSAYYAKMAEAEGGDDAFDAIVVEASVASPVPVASAYAVGIARIRTDAAGLSDLIFFDDIGALGPTPRQIKIRKEGLPVGFEIMAIDLHLYSEGQELVTNRSEKQFALTRDEAAEYLSLTRLSAHAGETVPAAPAWELAPAALFAQSAPAALDRAITVTVDEKGRCTGIEPADQVPPTLAAIAQQLLFLPALQDGTPVPATVTINLRDFFR